MNFSWLSGEMKGERGIQGTGALLLTHHREVHRLQSLSMNPTGSIALITLLCRAPLSIKKGWGGQEEEGGDIAPSPCFPAPPPPL